MPPALLDGGGSGSREVADLRAMAAELERHFAGYKQRLAERSVVASSQQDDDPAASGPVYTGGGGVGSGGCWEEEPHGDSSGGDVRGRKYEAYVRRRDERLRQGWRARMQCKEAEVTALWAQLELGGRASSSCARERASSGGAPTTAGEEEQRKTEWNDDDDDKRRDLAERRSSDAALTPRRISGKKHERTRNFSSSTTTSWSHTDVIGRQRWALSLEQPPSKPHAVGDTGSKDGRTRPAGGAVTATPTPRPKTSLRRKNSVKGHGYAKPAGPKLPLSLPQRTSSGGLEELSREVVLPNADAAPAPVPTQPSEHVHGEIPRASPPGPFVGAGAGAANPPTVSPDGSGCREAVDAVAGAAAEAKNAEVKERGDEEADAASCDKLGNASGNLNTSESDTEPSYVYINKDAVEEQAMGGPPEPRAAAADAEPELCAKNADESAEGPLASTDAAAEEIATTNAEEAPARESSDESTFSGRLGGSSPDSAPPSCRSRDQSIERLLEADAVLLRKKRAAEKSAPKTPPGSAGSRVSGTPRTPREAARGFKKFLSFGKKNKQAREATVIDCTSPSVPSLAADDDNASGGWQSAGSIKPRMGCSDAASDDTDRGYPASPRACSLQSLVAASPAKSELAEIVPPLQEKSPKAHRSLFSFRSLNCGRG